MAKARKPAIAGVARPEGFLDDVVRPIIQKGAKAVAKKTLPSGRVETYTKFPADTSMGRAIRRGPKGIKDKIGYKAVDLSNETARKRAKAYQSAARKASETGKSAKKVDVLSSKARAARNNASGLSNSSVRKAAKGARRRGGYR